MAAQQSTLGCFFNDPVKKEGTKEEEIKETAEEEKVEIKKEKLRNDKEIKKPAELEKIKTHGPIKIENPVISRSTGNKVKINERYSYEVSPFRLRMIEYGI